MKNGKVQGRTRTDMNMWVCVGVLVEETAGDLALMGRCARRCKLQRRCDNIVRLGRVR